MDVTALARRLLESAQAHRTVGLEVLDASAGTARVALTTPATQTNIITSLHASGLVAILDATGLAAIIATSASEEQAQRLVPLGASATVDFRRPARGPLVGACSLDDEARAALASLWSGHCERARLATTTEITDSAGAVVCSGTFRWNVRLSA